jgi:hypothetical protein
LPPPLSRQNIILSTMTMTMTSAAAADVPSP